MKIKIIIVGVFFFIGCQQTFAKGGIEHYQDMQDIFPFEANAIGNNRIFDLYESLHSFIDECNWINTNLHKPNCISTDTVFSKMKFGDGNHRIWFHWGLCEIFPVFNSQVKKSELLVQYVNKHIGLKELSQQDKNRFWCVLENEEYDRIQVIRRKAPSAFGYSSEEYIEQIWAFVHVLYDIHMLGDHTTTEYDLVLPESRIRNDLFNSIKTLGGTENTELAEQFISYLKQSSPFIQWNPGSKSGSAQKLLDALKDEEHGFAHFILSCKGASTDYSYRFQCAGLSVKQLKSVKRAA